MEYPDIVNGLFEGLIVVFCFLNIKSILNDKKVRGFTLSYQVFLSLWSVWNLFYYSSLNQLVSTFSVFIAGVLGVYYAFLVFYYFFLEKNNKQDNKKERFIGLTITLIVFMFIGNILIILGCNYYSSTKHEWVDIANSCYEFIGGIVVVGNCMKIIKHKKIEGVNFWSIIFVISWGAWNLFYYYHLHQYFSWIAGLSIFIANCWWVYLIMYYAHKAKRANTQIVYKIRRN